MLVWLLKKIDLPENRLRNLVEKLTRIKIVASAAFYTVMVFIVVFGISGDVYAGFPRMVPYIIIAIFLFMAFIRMYQCMVDDSYIRQIAAKKVDDNEKKLKEKEQKTANKKDAVVSGSDEKQKKAVSADSAESEASKESAASEEPALNPSEESQTDAPAGSNPEETAAE